MPSPPLIVLAGATGHLGTRIARALRDRDARVRALVRKDGPADAAARLRKSGATVAAVDYDDVDGLAQACKGAICVVSALSGLRDVVLDAQTLLLGAAIKAGVPRFIPSDYAIDFPKMPLGYNRNLDLRREFHERLDRAPIAATSILNGMFMDMLTGQAPVVLFRIRRVLVWGNPDQLMDFTTIDDTAEFTAAAALDPATPRFLRIAGDVASARGLCDIASAATGERFRLLRPGSLSRFEKVIKVTRLLAPGGDDVYPPWQGMQYMHNMLDGRVKLDPLDNDRYPGMRWTTVRDVLAAHVKKNGSK